MEKSYKELAEEFDIKEKSKRTKIRIAKKILFFPFRIIPKKVRNYIEEHYKNSNKITLFSEFCGIVGFIISIIIFFYTMNISNTQNEMEKIARDKEMNNILDKSMFQKLSLLKEYRYNNLKYKSIINDIIAIEEDFYDLVLLSEFSILEDNIPKNISKNDSINFKISKAFFKNITMFMMKSSRILALTNNTYITTVKSGLLSDSLYLNLLTVQVSNMNTRMKKFNKIQNEINTKLQSLNTELDKNKTAENSIKIANDFNVFLKKENILYFIINHIRNDVNFLDYIVTQELLKQENMQ